MADLILNDVLTKKLVLKDFLYWLKSNHANDKDKSYRIDSSLFIRYFVNYVRENCSWLLSKNAKNCSNSSTPKKSIKNTAGVKDRKSDNIVDKLNANRKEETSDIPKEKILPNDCDNVREIKIQKGIAVEDQNKILNFTASDVRTSFVISDQNSLTSSPTDVSSVSGRAKRRITPTPIQRTYEASSKFTHSDFANPPPKVLNQVFETTPYVQADVNLQNEREMLKLTKTKLSQNASPKLSKGSSQNSRLNQSPKTENLQYVIPNPELVTRKDQILILSEIYNFLLTQAMVPNVVAELYFLFELITAKITDKDKSQTNNVFSSIHNCVYFAISVLNQQHDLLLLLDNTTLTLISKITFLVHFSPELVMFLEMSQLNFDDVKLSTSNYFPYFFQENESHLQAKKVINFTTQQQLFNELLNEWQMQSLNCSDSKLPDRFAYKVRKLMNLCTSSADLNQLALLFEFQLVSRCMCLEINEGCDELLNNMQKHFPGKFEKLQERFVIPFSTGEPNPPPKFYGVQNFFIEFIQHASSPSFNQYLLDVFISKILELNDFDISLLTELKCNAKIKQIYTFLVLALRLLGKFLGYVYFLPYRENNILPSNIASLHLSFRKHRIIPINALKLLKVAIKKQKTILIVPWIVEFLSMIDAVAKNVEEVQDILKFLFIIYRGASPFHIQKNNHLFLQLLIGWLFDVLDYTEPFISEHCSVEFLENDNVRGIDSEQIVDKELVHSCCVYLVEFKVLIYNFVHGIKIKDQKVRKITPLSTTKPKTSSMNKQGIENQLVEAFPTLRTSSIKKIVKTTKFIAKCMTYKVINKINVESKDMQLKYAENVRRSRQQCIQTAKSKFFEEHQQITEFITSSAKQLFKTFKSHDFIYNACYEEIKTLISLLLSEDIKCIGNELSEECSKLSLQMTCNKIMDWCDANLSIDDFKCDFNSSLKHPRKVVENVAFDFSVSNIINFFRRLAVKIHSRSINSLPEEFFQMLHIASCFVKHNHIIESTKKLLVLITIDLYIGLLTFSPKLCCDRLDAAYTNLWYCSKDYVSENSFLCHQHVKFLLSSEDFGVSWTKYANMIVILMQAKVFKVRELKKCLKGLKNNWSGLNLFEPFSYLKSVLKYFEENHVDNLSVNHES